MFLLPALLSALTDLSILYVGLRGRHNDDGKDYDEDGFDDQNAGESSPPLPRVATIFLHILLFCSAVRLVVLMYPLSHHTFKGTRIPYQKIHYAFHCLSLGAAAACLIWLLINAEEHSSSGGWKLHVDLEPDGLPSGLHPFLKGRGNSNGSTTNNTTVAAKISHEVRTFLEEGFGGFVREEVGDGRDYDDKEDGDWRNLQDEHQPVPTSSSILIDHLWIISVLSFLSTFFHVVILMHVRSTAPMEYSIVRDDNRRKDRKVMAYYAYRRFYGSNGDGADEHDIPIEASFEVGSPSKNIIAKKPVLKKKTSGNMTYSSIPAAENIEGAEDSAVTNDEALGRHIFRRSGASAGSSSSSKNSGPVIVALPNDSLPSRPSQSQKSRGNSFGSALGRYDEIMSDLQHTLNSARRQWSARLEDVQRNLNAQLHGGDGVNFALDDSGGTDSRQASPLRGLSPPISSGMGRLLQLSPFQALLQLYAYEDVIGTGKLDKAFGIGKHYDEDSATALVFYAPQLLSFLLHGAFLSSSQLERWILDCCRTNIHFAHRCFWFLRGWALGQGKFEHSNVGADDDSTVPDVEAAASLGAMDIESLPSSSSMRSLSKRCGSETNLYLVDSQQQQSGGAKTSGERPEYIRRNSKFPIEEHRLIEDLLQRIIECCGEAIVKLRNDPLDVGHTSANGETTTLSTGRASPYQSTEDLVKTGMVPIDTATGKPSDAHLRALNSSSKGKYIFQPRNNGLDAPETELENQFLSTPKFLDALTSIADDLMLVEKADRTKELRNRLRSLEVELLPSNVIYLPSTADVHHQIWRAVPEESVALSTNERVPCIITFEVLSHPQDESQEHRTSLQGRSVDEVARSIHDAVHGRSGEGDALKSWFQDERPAQRHNTVRDKLSTFGRRLRNDIDANFHLQRDRFFEVVGAPNSDGEVLFPDTDEDVATSSTIYQVNGDTKAAQDIAALAKVDGGSSRPPMIPSGSASSSVGLTSRGKMTAASSPSSSRASSRPPSPSADFSSSQWHSPGLEKKKAKVSTDLLNVRTMTLRGEAEGINSLVLPSLGSHHDQDVVTSTNVDSKKKETKKKRSRPPPVVFKEDWSAKEERVRSSSAFGTDPNWKLLPVLVKSNDDCRQEQLASQIIHRCASILARAKIPVWLYPYEIIALSDRCGLIEAIPDTISLSSLKGNIPEYVDLKTFFVDHFGQPDSDEHAQAKANFVESLAAYSMVCYLLQIKDRHNGNILLTSRGHLIHIDFGFFFLSSPGKNSGFESAPFKFTSEFIDLMDGPDSHTLDKFRELCYKTFIELRKHCYQIILITEMLAESGEDLQCFRGQPERAIEELRQRFRLDLTDRACKQYVDSLIDESAGSWRTGFYDAYQRVCVGVL